MGITRARKRLFLSHARTRALYNTRNANPLSRFVTEIPPRLIVDGMGSTQPRRVPPPSTGGGWSQPTRSPYNARWQQGSGAASTGSAELDKKLGIPGVQKGGFNWNGGGQTRVAGPAGVFRVGDAVHHRVFGRGEVTALTGQGAEQRVKIRFANGNERTFSAVAAPIVKVEK